MDTLNKICQDLHLVIKHMVITNNKGHIEKVKSCSPCEMGKVIKSSLMDDLEESVVPIMVKFRTVAASGNSIYTQAFNRWKTAPHSAGIASWCWGISQLQ